MPSLTAEQAQALETRDVSIALAAGAGCGKTFVLTERFLSHLDKSQLEGVEPAELSQLIAITFTDAAAREMRSRIRDKCRERLLRAPDGDQQYWLGLLRAIEAARVSTIHAFCASLLRAHAVAIDLDPAFIVLDQSDAIVLESEVTDDVLREKLAIQDDDVLELAAEFGLANLKRQIAALVDRRHDAAFERWLDATPDEVVAAWRACYDRDSLRIALHEIVASVPIAELIALLQGVATQKPAFVEARADLLALLPRLTDATISLEELQIVGARAGVRRICTAKDWTTPDEYHAYKSACTALRNAIHKKAPAPFNATVAEETASLGLKLLRLVGDVVARYEQRKSELSALDFDDLLAHAYRLLTHRDHADVQMRLSSELRLLLVDEFQDTNQLQVELVKALCGDGFTAGRLFFVGDEKQSIYRFRGAEPRIFQRLRDEVHERGNLPLSINFRSQPAILSFVNALFHEAFVPYQPLRANRLQTTAEPAIELLWAITPNKNSGSAGMKGAAKEARREEARWIARRLRAMLDSAEPVVVDPTTDQARPARLGDIAILFRALSDVQVYEEALRDYGLDYYLVGGQAYYAQQEIYDVLNLLRAVASAADEISLAGALRSPFFSLADETLFWLVESAGSLNAGLFGARLPPELSPEERAKSRAAARTLEYLRQRKDAIAITELLGEALALTGYDAVLLGDFLGERKLANLHKLLEQARTADASATMELDGFITQLAQFVAKQPKESLAATSPEAADVIRLMTIHQSKGLEFPVVVVPDLDRSESFRSEPAALDFELGPLVESPDDDEVGPTTTGMRLYKGLEKLATLEERKRLLYVAVTRAADYLILSSSLEAFDAPKSDWMKLIGSRFDLESGALLATLPESYDSPLIRSTHTMPPTDFKPLGAVRGPDLRQLLTDARDVGPSHRFDPPLEVEAIPVDLPSRAQFSFSRISGQFVRAEKAQRGEASEAEHALTPVASLVPRANLDVDPRALGSLVHEVLERIDFAADSLVQAPLVREWCEQFASELILLNPNEGAREAEQLVLRFLASPRGRELATVASIQREVEFMLAWAPTNGDTPMRYLQGYIDCLYQDQRGDVHLIDYKTNQVTAEAVPREARKYEMQMYVYAMAVERALGMAPCELVLHFLKPGKEFKFEWHDDARQRAIEMVNNALQANITDVDSLVTSATSNSPAQ